MACMVAPTGRSGTVSRVVHMMSDPKPGQARASDMAEMKATLQTQGLMYPQHRSDLVLTVNERASQQASSLAHGAWPLGRQSRRRSNACAATLRSAWAAAAAEGGGAQKYPSTWVPLLIG
eukprot:6197091-Pleurochrysis_carterae.AAC.10